MLVRNGGVDIVLCVMAIQSHVTERIEVDVTELAPANEYTGIQEKTTVFVRALTAREKDKYEESLVSFKGKKRKIDLSDSRARMAVLCCVDENNRPIFKPEDVDWLSTKSAKALTRIADAAKQLNEISDEDEEELLKNSEATQTYDS